MDREAEYIATIRRARNNGLTSIWTGDLRRNPYLAECFQFAIDNGYFEAKLVENYEAQESNYELTWLEEP